MNPYTQTASQMLREAAINNCKEICNVMQQEESLWREKFKRFVQEIENPAYVSPEEMYRRVYNASLNKLNQLKERVV